MTTLRQKMIDEMLRHGFAERTKSTYLATVRKLAKHFHQAPDRLSPNQIQDYFLYLIKDRGLSPASCRLCLNALKFLYVEVLKQLWFSEMNLVIPKKEQRIPELLSREEVSRILSACKNQKHHALLSTGYACGLRVSELAGFIRRQCLQQLIPEPCPTPQEHEPGRVSKTCRCPKCHNDTLRVCCEIAPIRLTRRKWH